MEQYLCSDAAQTTEVAVGITVLDRMIDLGHSTSVRFPWPTVGLE